MAWSTVTLSTLNSLARLESEINNLAGTFTRHTLKLEAAGVVVIAGGSVETDDLTVTYIDDTTETLTHNGVDGWTVVTGGYAINISQSDSLIFPCITGSGDIYDTSGVRYIDISECTDVAWNDSIIQTSWQNKINTAKSIIGNELKKQLAQLGYRDSNVTGGEVLDYVSNTDALNLTSDYLSMKLIYMDLYATQLTEAYMEKASYYDKQYQDELQKALYQIEFTIGGTAVPLYGVYGTRLTV